MPSPEDVKLYHDALLNTINRDQQVRWFRERGREFCYRPGQLLVAERDLARVTARLQERQLNPQPGRPVGRVPRILLSQEANIPAIVADLRDVSQWRPDERVPAVQPHHVTIGFGNIMGSPYGAPTPAAPLPGPDPAHAVQGAGVTVGICDTGIWASAPSRHPAWLGGSYTVQADDQDKLYDHGTVLALQGGHGTFVAGVLRQAAPGARFDPEVALNPVGVGDEETLVNALGALEPGVAVISLSLGCFTQDNLAPMPLALALADAWATRPELAVVAAAGNAGTDRPSWPAAFDKVIAVGAVTSTSSGPVPAEYSNYGPWVDACADGDRTSTYVDGTWEMAGTPPTAFGGYARWVGTSFAAPFVAGRLATMMSTMKISAAQARLALLAEPRWHADYGVLVT